MAASVADCTDWGNVEAGENVLRLLEGFVQCGPHRARALCPFHNDHTPSLVIDVIAKNGGPVGVWINCPICPEKVNGVMVADHYGIPRGKLLYGSFPSFGKRQTRPASLPSPSVVRQRSRAMRGQVASDFYAWRDIGWRTRRAYDVGWNERAQRYELPVRASKGGPVVNVRWAKLRYEGQSDPGLRGLTGRGIHLYPYPPGDDRWVLLTEGEWDCLMARQVGLPAYGVPGAGQWEPTWAPHFRGKKVVVMFDSDQSGRDGAAARARSLAPYVRDVRVVDLYPSNPDKAGDRPKDLSDFLSSSSADQLKNRIRTTLGKRKGQWQSHKAPTGR